MESDIEPDGYRNVDSLCSNCERLFPVDRRFCSVCQLEAALHKFSNSWGFTSSRYGKEYFCHYASRKVNEGLISTTTSTKTSRGVIKSAKDKTNCPFFIRFSVNKRQSILPHWALTPDGQLRHSDCCPVIITANCFRHTCSPGALSQRYAIKKSGRAQPHRDKLLGIINLMRDAGDLDNKILRNLLHGIVPTHISTTDQYLRNFQRRIMKFVMDPNLIEKREQDLHNMLEGHDFAANEITKFDEGVMGENLRLLMIAQLNNGDALWRTQAYLEQSKKQLQGFDFRIWIGKDHRPQRIVWMTQQMKKRLVRYGTVLFVDYMKRKYNSDAWPYCGPVILDGNNEIGVVGESLNVAESLDGYFFVLSSIFDMVPEFDRTSIKLIFADDFINISVLERLGIQDSAILRADNWHLTHEQLPKFFGTMWIDIEEPMKQMLTSGSKEKMGRGFQ